MVAKRACSGITTGGTACGAPPVHGSQFCLWHDPARAEEVAEARRLGGLRRRRETAVLGAFDFEGLGSVAQIRRLVEVAVIDVLSLENSVARGRAIAYLAQIAAKLLEVGELEDRLDRIEQTLEPRLVRGKR